MGSGLLQAQAMALTHGQSARLRLEELPTDYDSSMLAAAAVSAEAAIVAAAAAAAAAATMTTAGFQLSTHTPAPAHTLQLATTLRAGYGKQHIPTLFLWPSIDCQLLIAPPTTWKATCVVYIFMGTRAM